MFEIDPSRKGERTKDKILSAAVELFAKHGFESTSFSQIADLVKLSQSAVMHHYPSKDVLLRAVIDRILIHNHDLVARKISSGDSGLYKLSVYFEESMRWAIVYRDESQIIFLLYYMSCYNKNFSKLYKQILVAVRKRIYSYLQEAREAGEIPKNLDLESTTYLLHDALLGGVVNWITTQNLAGKAAMRIHNSRWALLFEALLGVKAAKAIRSLPH